MGIANGWTEKRLAEMSKGKEVEQELVKRIEHFAHATARKDLSYTFGSVVSGSMKIVTEHGERRVTGYIKIHGSRYGMSENHFSIALADLDDIDKTIRTVQNFNRRIEANAVTQGSGWERGGTKRLTERNIA